MIQDNNDNQPKPKGGFKKISEPLKEEKCLSSGHKPPMHIVLQPGTYEYTCPSCGHVTIVKVPLIT